MDGRTSRTPHGQNGNQSTLFCEAVTIRLFTILWTKTPIVTPLTIEQLRWRRNRDEPAQIRGLSAGCANRLEFWRICLQRNESLSTDAVSDSVHTPFLLRLRIAPFDSAVR